MSSVSIFEITLDCGILNVCPCMVCDTHSFVYLKSLKKFLMPVNLYITTSQQNTSNLFTIECTLLLCPMMSRLMTVINYITHVYGDLKYIFNLKLNFNHNKI